MFFEVKPAKFNCPSHPTNQVYLIKDNWNDWFKYSTLFYLCFVDNNGALHEIGSTKIGQINWKKDHQLENDLQPHIPQTFDFIGEQFFSLGQDVDFYKKLNLLREDIRVKILYGLRDVSYDINLFESTLHENVMIESLLRYVSSSSVRGQFKRLANGDAKLTHYYFKYKIDKYFPFELSFKVNPKSNPPSNLHVLIGRNGVGKTFLIRNMINSLVSSEKIDNQLGYFELSEKNKKFANIVLVSFSAFDEDWILNSLNEKTLKIKYYYVGILEEENMPKNSLTLAKEFQQSLSVIKKISRLSLWTKCMKMLEADPIFKEINITNLVLNNFNDLKVLFKKLSSGHKKVLLTITKLVQLVEECTLVFLDEPEGHLHPPLLSAFTRALSSLLLHRNGVAIIATHSPILLQEVPKNCVWIIRRNGNIMMSERPEIETFGENLGVLTQEIFGLEVTHSGFHQLLNESVNQHLTYEDVIDDFNGDLGLEARAIIKSLFYNKDKR